MFAGQGSISESESESESESGSPNILVYFDMTF